MNGSQIRPSEIKKIQDRVRKDGYNHYLKKIYFKKLRGLENTEISFDFPVTAIVGPNGSGKSTVLGAAGLTCEELAPRTFFARSGNYDSSMKGWSAEYTLLRPDEKPGRGKSVNMTASYRRAKWNRNAINRPVIYVGITRTIPAAERAKLTKFIGGSFKADYEEKLTEETKKAVAKILGKNAESYIRVSNEELDDFSHAQGKAIYATQSNKTASYSEFHFGAGEASIISIVDQIERAGKEALILIEELENGLHPVATKRLVEYLIDVSRRRGCQVVFTTHSNDALAPLPGEAVWSIARGQLYQGKLDVASLRALTGEIETTCAIFVEDKFARHLAEVSLRNFRPDSTPPQAVDFSQIEIHTLGGANQVIEHTRSNNASPLVRYPVIGLLDGDMKDDPTEKAQPTIQTFDEINFSDIVFGPGTDDPEYEVYSDVMDSLISSEVGNMAAKLTIALGFQTESQGLVKENIESVWHSNHDPHLLFAQLGEALDFLAAEFVERAFLTIWCAAYPDKVKEMWEPATDILPYTSASIPFKMEHGSPTG